MEHRGVFRFRSARLTTQIGDLFKEATLWFYLVPLTKPPTQKSANPKAEFVNHCSHVCHFTWLKLAFPSP